MRIPALTIGVCTAWLTLATFTALPAGAAPATPPPGALYDRFDFSGTLVRVTGPGAEPYQALVGAPISGNYLIPVSDAARERVSYGGQVRTDTENYEADPHARLRLDWQGARLMVSGAVTNVWTDFRPIVDPKQNFDWYDYYTWRGYDLISRSFLSFGYNNVDDYIDGLPNKSRATAQEALFGAIKVGDNIWISSGASHLLQTILWNPDPRTRLYEEPIVSGNYDGAVFSFADLDSLRLRDLVIATPGVNWTFDVTTAPPQVVPLPAAAWLLGSALAGLWAVRRHRRTREPG